MARKITPERKERRKLLQDAGINDVEGVQELFKETVGTVCRRITVETLIAKKR